MTSSPLIQRRSSCAWGGDVPDTLHPRLQSIYSARGITQAEQLKRDLGDLLRPNQLLGMADAVALLVTALEQRWRILVVGDFDADGATSSALACLALRAMGCENVDYLVPNRFEFGYGLTPEIVEVAKRHRPDLIVTVDNGIASVEGVSAANSAGIKVLVTDHHLPGAELPAAEAIVNPNQPNCRFGSKNLAGVGVIFYLMSALRAALREVDWFQRSGLEEPNMANYLDLVALGTVADVVPLDANNRILVYQGVQRIRSGRARPGILALLTVANRRPERLVASDLGFVVGPRLNAAGRLDDMSLGIDCLTCESPNLAMEMAVALDDLNRDRKAIESGMQEDALKALRKLQFDEAEQMPWGIALYDSTWHQGVIGIVASRIKERFHRPVIAFADGGDSDEIKGSARSIEGLHIRDALDQVASQHPGLLTKFGGHAMAAGLSLKKEDFQRFAKAFDQVVRSQLQEDQLQAVIWSDGALSEQDLSLPLAYTLREAGPWGQHFPEPLFDNEFYVIQERVVGEKHLKLVVSLDPDGHQCLDAIWFNADLDDWVMPSGPVKLVYSMDVNEFRGRESLQLLVRHLQLIE